MQKKFFDLLEDALAGNVDVVVNQEWANRGQVYVQKVGTFKNLVTFGYDFQSDSASFDIVVAKPDGGTIGYKPMINFRTGSLMEVIETILNGITLSKRRQPAPTR